MSKHLSPLQTAIAVLAFAFVCLWAAYGVPLQNLIYDPSFYYAHVRSPLIDHDLDFANEANERLTCQFDGEDMEIGFNARFLVEMLSNLDSENVTIEMSAPNRAGILFPTEAETAQDDILMLVMPVMLNN